MPLPLRPLMMLVTLLIGLGSTPARAGSITAESIWDQNNALQRALQQVPAGAQVLVQRCETIDVGFNNERYRCTVDFAQPADGSGPAPTPSPAPAPAPAP